MPERLNLLAGMSSDGRPAFEEVLVERRGSGTYLLIASPGLVLGIAAGDLLEVEETGRFRVVARGRNVCIQVFAKGDLGVLSREVEEEFSKLGGRVDGRASREIVVTVPVDAGFPRIERALSDLAARHTNMEWYYGNVYDPADGVTPLGWWKDPRISDPQ